MVFKSFIQFVNENDWSPSTNFISQQTTLKQIDPDYEDEDDEDRWNPSIINKFAASDKDGVAYISKKVSEGGLGDNQIAGQRIYTQTVDRSKQGYQDSMYYEDPGKEEHPDDCDCPLCLKQS